MTTAPPVDLIQLLTRDHELVKERFAALTTGELGERGPLFWKLTDDLVRHEVAEEVVVYPTIRSAAGAAEVADACIAEQSRAEERLARMEKEDPTTRGFMDEVQQLEGEVLGHAEHEERDVFPLLRQLPGEQLVSLGERYTTAKTAAPNHPHPSAPDTPPGNLILGPVAALIDRVRDAAVGV
jgi:hemerythrin superfamily protein